MSSTLWLQRQLNDPYVARAKREGWRSRAAFKLLEMDEKYQLLQPGQKILITNQENEHSQECVVEFLGVRMARGVDVAFEFPAPMPEFWTPRELVKAAAGESGEACA